MKSLQKAAAEKENGDGAVSSRRLLGSRHNDTSGTSCFVGASTASRHQVLAFHESFATLQERATEYTSERKIPFEAAVTGWDKLGRMNILDRIVGRSRET